MKNKYHIYKIYKDDKIICSKISKKPYDELFSYLKNIKKDKTIYETFKEKKIHMDILASFDSKKEANFALINEKRTIKNKGIHKYIKISLLFIILFLYYFLISYIYIFLV
jgi:ABC-type transporter MlaC component